MNLTTAKKILAAFVLALLLLAGVAAISFHRTMRMTADAQWVDHSYEVMTVIEKLVKTVSYNAVSHRGFLITNDEAFLAKHPQTILERNAAMEELRSLVADSPAQRQRLTELAAGIAEREQLAKNHVELRRREGFEAVQKNVASGRGERMLERIYTVAAEMTAHERTLLNERVDQSEASARATRWAITAASAVAFLLVGGALWRLTRELEKRRKSDAALRKSEARFRALATAISDVVYRMAPDWSEMHQLESREFLTPSTPGNRKWLQEYIHPDDQPQVMAAIQESIRTKSKFQLEHRVLRADGSVGWTISRAVPIQDSKGEIVEWFGAASDVTARKQAQQALMESEEALRNFNSRLAESVVERTKELRSTVQFLENEIAARRRLEGEILKVSEREQTRLGQDLHDDLGQQLTGIAILSQVLLSQLQEESHPAAKDAEQISRSLTESISTTRNLAKSFYPVELERGGLILALQDLALRTQLLSRVHCTVNAAADFRFETPTEIHLYRIVQESINNALKHGKATHIQIDCPRENGVSTLTVTDNGNGFKPPEPGEETGMGLHIFQYRAALIGARISVRRGTPDGCVVTCAIPDYFSHA